MLRVVWLVTALTLMRCLCFETNHLSFVIPITSETANLHFAGANNKQAHQPVKCWEIGCLCGAVCLFKSAISFPSCPSAHGFLGSIKSVFLSSIIEFFIPSLLIIKNLLKYLCTFNYKCLIYSVIMYSVFGLVGTFSCDTLLSRATEYKPRNANT